MGDYNLFKVHIVGGLCPPTWFDIMRVSGLRRSRSDAIPDFSGYDTLEVCYGLYQCFVLYRLNFDWTLELSSGANRVMDNFLTESVSR